MLLSSSFSSVVKSNSSSMDKRSTSLLLELLSSLIGNRQLSIQNIIGRVKWFDFDSINWKSWLLNV